MESLPAEILVKIALYSPQVWVGLLNFRIFAELSLVGKTIRAGLKHFDAMYGPNGGEYSKHYAITNYCEGAHITSRSNLLRVRKDIRDGFSDPALWFVKTGADFVADPNYWGKKLARYLSGYYYLCLSIYQANSFAPGDAYLRKKYVCRSNDRTMKSLEIFVSRKMRVKIDCANSCTEIEYEYSKKEPKDLLSVKCGTSTILFCPDYVPRN